jgi:hypothetical protein
MWKVKLLVPGLEPASKVIARIAACHWAWVALGAVISITPFAVDFPSDEPMPLVGKFEKASLVLPDVAQELFVILIA